jgi:hypothetical protein
LLAQNLTTFCWLIDEPYWEVDNETVHCNNRTFSSHLLSGSDGMRK